MEEVLLLDGEIKKLVQRVNLVIWKLEPSSILIVNN